MNCIAHIIKQKKEKKRSEHSINKTGTLKLKTLLKSEEVTRESQFY